MSSRTSDRYSVLIVSSSEQFNIIAEKSLPSSIFNVIEKRKSASAARRELLVRDYDIILINAPLSDGLGTDFVLDLVEKHAAGVILVVPSEIHNDVMNHLINYGVITIAKPFKKGELDRSIRLLIALGKRVKTLRKQVRTLEDKMEELKVVSRAKIKLVERGMKEEEAHEHIIREAMNSGMTKRQVAEEIISDDKNI